MSFPTLEKKTVVITMVDSPGGQFIGVLLAKQFKDMGVNVLLVVNTDLRSQVEMYGLSDNTIMAGEIRQFASGHEVFKLGLEPAKLVKASLEILANNVPPLMAELYNWVQTTNIDPQDIVFLGNSMALAYFGAMLLEMGIFDLNSVDPYLLVNFKGGWSGGDKGQLLGNDLLAPWVVRFLYVKAGKQYASKIMGRPIRQTYDTIVRHIRNQIQIISPQLLNHTAKPKKHYFVVGYPYPLMMDYPVPEELSQFLAGGNTGILTIGSMDLDPGEKRKLAEDAIAAADEQGYKLLVLGIDGPATDQSMFYTDFIPYEAIFPLAAFTIQHGGSGTIHGAMKAGVPIIVVPFLADQPNWAARAKARGFGLGGVPYIDLTQRDLSIALSQLRHAQPPMKQIAQQYALREQQLPDTYHAILEILAG